MDVLKSMSGKDFMIVKLYFSVLWFSWNNRNKAKHGKSEDSASTIAANAISFVGMDKRSMVLSGYWDAGQSYGLFSESWHPPPPEWYKINIDAALSDYGAGIGSIIRDFKGRFILAFGFYGVHWDIAQVELLAFKALNGLLRDCLLIAKGIIFEGDNKNVIQVLHNMYNKERKVGDTKEEVDFSFLEHWNNVIFHCVGRNCNKVADYYANLAFSYDFIWELFCESELPSSFVNLVKEECGLVGNSH
ncbi:hypothetical protein M5K25_012969 [Dendrobium thyrsiflorum]|uniref:RNase H type-1 domain-containing protein n=1 Tax=Dendrobium thyrsiflorum TaxID=117978 RepID=A0ABD0UYR5_DENTH